MKNIFLPVYVSKDIVKILTVYGSPRYNYRISSVEKTKNGVKVADDTCKSHMVGGALGISINLKKNFHLIGEYDFLQDLTDSNINQSQAGVALRGEF